MSSSTPAGAGAKTEGLPEGPELHEQTLSKSGFSSPDGSSMKANDDHSPKGVVDGGGGESDPIGSDGMTRETRDIFRATFYETVKQEIKTPYLSKDEYNRAVSVLQNWKKGETRTPFDRKVYKKYVLASSGTACSRLRAKDSGTQKIVTKEDLFEVIHHCHAVKHCHAGHNRSLYKYLKDQHWHGITEATLDIYLKLCPICHEKGIPKIGSKQQPLNMIVSININNRAQMDLIDMTSLEDTTRIGGGELNGYRWILRVVDHFSGYQAARSLFTKTAHEVALNLLPILVQMPDFNILQSDNGGEFFGAVIDMVNT